MVDFNSVLAKASDQIEKPKAKPVGTYLAIVQGLPLQREVKPRDGGEDMGVIQFKLKLISPMSDVDMDQLSDHPPIPEWGPMNQDIFIHTEAGIYGLKKFLVNTLGVEPGEGKHVKTIGQMLAEAPGRQLLVKTKHVPYQDRQTGETDIASNIESTAHV